MGLLNAFRRRVLGKMHPLLKRLVLPGGALLLVLHVMTWGDRSMTPMGEPPNVLPGEALDPLVKPRYRNPVDKRPVNAFETVLQSAAAVDQQIEVGLSSSPTSTSLLTDSKKINKPYRGTAEKKVDNVGAEPPTREEEATLKETDSHTKEKRQAENIRDSEWSMAKANIPGHEKVKFPGHQITENTVTLTVMSSSDKVFMSLNKREIYRGLEERGLHVVVLHPHTGRVMAARVFDTFYNGTEEEMIHFLNDVQDGRIIVFAVRDEAATGLTWKGRNKLVELGSRFAKQLAYRDMWILVTKTGGLKLAESYSNVAEEDTLYEWGGPLFLRTDFDLTPTADYCKWEESYQEDLRQRFCQRFEGYGKLCHCSVNNFDDVFFKSDPKVAQAVKKSPLSNDLAIAVLARDRPHYLYRTLKAIRESAGSRSGRVVVFIEREHREIAALVKLFSMQLVITGQREGHNITAPTRIKDKIQFIFRELMGVEFPPNLIPAGMRTPSAAPPLSTGNLLMLDDDVELSIDYFKFLTSVAPVLERDLTLVGVTCFNYNSYAVAASSLADVYRTDRMQQVALMIPARTVHDYLLPGWPPVHANRNWYHGLDRAMEKKTGLGILYPEVSRCQHFSYSGHRIRGTLQYSFFANHKMALTTDYAIPQHNVDRLEQAAYDSWQVDLIKRSRPTSFDFCTYAYGYGEDPLVVFVKYDGDMSNDKDLVATLRCLGAWHLYGEGEWRRTWHLHYHGHPVTVVAVPGSPYSNLMPSDYEMVDMTNSTQPAM